VLLAEMSPKSHAERSTLPAKRNTKVFAGNNSVCQTVIDDEDSGEGKGEYKYFCRIEYIKFYFSSHATLNLTLLSERVSILIISLYSLVSTLNFNPPLIS
jgi:hypothetical protein